MISPKRAASRVKAAAAGMKLPSVAFFDGITHDAIRRHAVGELDFVCFVEFVFFVVHCCSVVLLIARKIS